MAEAARRLKVSAVEVSKAARKLWGHSLSAERDRRVSEKTPEISSRRTRQALRGHVSRALTAEIKTMMASSSSGKATKAAHLQLVTSKPKDVRRRGKQSTDEEP
jgi:hypothetical protein